MSAASNRVYGIIHLIVSPSKIVALVGTNDPRYENPYRRQSLIEVPKMSSSQYEQLSKVTNTRRKHLLVQS